MYNNDVLFNPGQQYSMPPFRSWADNNTWFTCDIQE